jgi:hypothetical protein
MSEMTRRDVLRRTAAVGGGAALISVGGEEVPRLSPVGRAHALGFTGAVIVGVAAVAGSYAYEEYVVDGETSVDVDKQVEDSVYQAATSVAQGREDWEEQLRQEFMAPDDPEQTPYGRTAWQEVRTAATKEIVNGGSESDAVAAAKTALDRATSRAAVNTIERWNTGINALIEQMVYQHEEGVNALEFSNGQSLIATDYVGTPVESAIPSGTSSPNSMVHEVEVSGLPTDVTSFDDRSEPLTALMPVFQNSNGTTYALNPVTELWIDVSNNVQINLWATHSSLETKVVLSGSTYYHTTQAIANAYDSISSDLSTYVGELYQGIQQGAIEPSDILSSSDIIEEFADAPAQERLAAELLAIGAQVPNDVGYRARISHPDLQADSLWGWLFPQFSGEPVDIGPGTTLASVDYDMAYFGYQGSNSDEFEKIILTGDLDLQIHDVDGVEGQEEVDTERRGAEAGANGRVVVWSGDSPPDPIANPADNSGWRVLVQGETNRDTAAVADVTQDGTEYVLSTTSIPEGELIDYVELVPPVQYKRSHDYVADPTNPDTQATIDRLNSLREQVEELKAVNEESGGGGGSWLDDADSLGDVPDVALAGGAALLALLGLNTLN